MNLINYNKHWNEGFLYKFKLKRVYFDELKKELNLKFIQLLIGLRRVGKTSLMFQLINHLIKEKGIKRNCILYYSFDNGGEISEIINQYLKIANKDLIKDNFYIFFDEIQNVKNWQNKIKSYYDLYPNIKFVLSGSSSVFLKSTESLAGRIYETTIKPLFFEEFLEFKDKKYYLEQPRLYESNLILEFEKYLYRQFFDIIDADLMTSKKYLEKLKNKIIKEDAKKFFDIKYPDLLIKIFDIISANPGSTIDYTHLGNDLSIDFRTVQTYIYYLEESFLVNRVYNYSKNLLTSEKKQKKIYLNCCSFFQGNGEITGELYENYIQNYFDFKYFYRFNKQEVDFIGVKENGRIAETKAIEVKYREIIKKDFFKGLNFFEKKFFGGEKNFSDGKKIFEKIVISKNISEKNGENFETKIFPFWEIGEIFK